MRLAKGFFLLFLAAEWLHYRRRPPTGRQPAANRPTNRREFAEPVGDVNCNSTSTISSNSRMRLAKGFFLPFLAAEWLHYRRRAPTGRQPAANRLPTGCCSRSLLVIEIVIVLVLLVVIPGCD